MHGVGCGVWATTVCHPLCVCEQCQLRGSRLPFIQVITPLTMGWKQRLEELDIALHCLE